jgi:paraquat-inducible protein A
MVVPLLELLMLFFITVSVKLRRCSAALVYCTRKASLISRWGMLDVYLLGILVAMIKMGDIGEILMGPALWAYVALMLSSIVSAAVFDEHEVWQFVEASQWRS